MQLVPRKPKLMTDSIIDTLHIDGWRENVESRIQGLAREAGVLGGVKGHKKHDAILVGGTHP